MGAINGELNVKDLSFAYEDGTQALDKLSLIARAGEVTGILGANGAGKSTLFLTLNGVLTPTSGEVILGGQPVSWRRRDLPELRRRVGIVFQDPDDQLFSADVYRDVSFGAVNLGLPEGEVRRRVEDALARTGAASFAHKPTHALSYGQKKRAAIAGVLVMEPEVLILDEPTAGLDPEGVEEMVELLGELGRDRHRTILLATHDMDLVAQCCHRVCLLEAGRTVWQGTPPELFRQRGLLEAHHLRLPPLARLMAELAAAGCPTDPGAATVEAAKNQILPLWRERGEQP